ncbi:hypothetical protein, partial [Acinetobacter baumannii]
LGYAVCAVAVSIGVSNFLSRRDVPPAQIWRWQGSAPIPQDEEQPEGMWPWMRRYLAADRGELRWFFYAVAAG